VPPNTAFLRAPYALVNVSFLSLSSKVEPRNQRQLVKFCLNGLPGDLSVDHHSDMYRFTASLTRLDAGMDSSKIKIPRFHGSTTRTNSEHRTR